MAELVTIVGFGSLLSGTTQDARTYGHKISARSTFGEQLRNFRLAVMTDYRRVFAHPASIFFERGIANLATKEIASLSSEPAAGCSFLISVFDIPRDLLPSFYEREEEFRIVEVPFQECDGRPGGRALMCTRWTDDEYINARSQEMFDTKYKHYGLDTIWGWDHESGILPCRVYLRHCLLAVQKLGKEVYDDFVTTTYLGDRQTTIQQYIAVHPSIMDELPPPHLINRYSG
uniref:Gamma-glutamylcyclotransferase AIG2-like domain-containing protein n=1 Tax=Globisporangium ultimum (strain ATCC 200006 / CBS 805.95 / DAOM BR144) TaxID=431595 RepID=K3WZH0_GLOUD